MTRVATEQVILLLRARLERLRSAAKGASRSEPQARAGAVVRTGRLLQDLPPPDRARALLFAILSEHFGSALANDRKFLDLIEDVHQLLSTDVEAARLLERAIEEAMTR